MAYRLTAVLKDFTFGLHLSESSVTIDVGATAEVSATLYGNDDDSTITWTVADESVATVSVSDNTATITGVAAGSTTISVATENYTKSVSVNVLGTQPTDLDSVSYNLYTGDTSTKDNDAILALLQSGVTEGTNIVSSVSDTAYCYGGYGDYLYLRSGSSSYNGGFTLNTTATVYKVDVSVAGWTASDTLSVGGADAWTPGYAYTAENAVQDHTFEFNGTNSVTFASANRVIYYSITLYYDATTLVA